MTKYVFGPVPSRRLGKSLGINNIPPKHCSYSCIYCQLGKTIHLEIERREFYEPNEVINEVCKVIATPRQQIDYITFVPDGEPTLDINLRNIAEKIKEVTDIPIAILTNASLLWRNDVQDDLLIFDTVSLKIDAVHHDKWKLINRPHPKLVLDKILAGIEDFSKKFEGRIITETMMIRNVNDDIAEIQAIAAFLSKLRIHKAYIAIPTRPPAEKWALPANEEILLQAHEIFVRALGYEKVELLTGYEGPDFGMIGDPIEALLSIVSVHPMRIDYARKFLEKAGLDSDSVIRKLLDEGKILKLNYNNQAFLMRKFL